MAQRSTSATLPQNRPDSDGPTSAVAAVTNGKTEKGDSKAPSEDAGKQATNGCNSSTNDTASVLTNKSSKFNRRDVELTHRYIAQAHNAVRHGSAFVVQDKDKDIAYLAEMVSQMTHLLAAAGIVSSLYASQVTY